MKVENSDRGQWKSNFGFIMAAAGSAVGLGNIWKFPYLAGANGGSAFVIMYLFMIVLLGFVIMLGEMAIGRYTQKSAIEAYKTIHKKWSAPGIISVIVSFCILSFYSVIGGWVLNYLFQYIKGGVKAEKASYYFESFIASTNAPIVWHGIFMLLCCIIVLRGVSGGIEKASKIMMPALFVLLVAVVVKSLTLDGAMEGVRFLFKPDFSKITFETVIAALGQAFFSLSLGMGALITYGSYLGKNENLEKNAIVVPVIDTAVALLSGLAVLPAVFAFGYEPSAGPSLMFITLPSIFDTMYAGQILGFFFFLLILFAALTSAIALLEVVVSFAIDSLHLKRKTATILLVAIIFLIGVPCSLANGPVLGDKLILGYNFFDFMSFLAESILMPVGAFLMCIFIGYVWGTDKAADEISSGGNYPFYSRKFFHVMMKYIAPVLIAIVWLNAIGVVDWVLNQFGG